MNGILADIHHAFRLYRSSPSSTAIVVFVLAVAIAFVTAFLSLYVDQALTPHSGFERGGRFVTLAQTDDARSMGFPFGRIERAADEMSSLDAVAGVGIETAQDSTGRVSFELVTHGFFEGLRPNLYLGRGLEPADHDPNGDAVAVISYRYWQDRFGGRGDVLGTTFEFELPLAVGAVRPENSCSLGQIVVMKSLDSRNLGNSCW